MMSGTMTHQYMLYKIVLRDLLSSIFYFLTLPLLKRGAAVAVITYDLSELAGNITNDLRSTPCLLIQISLMNINKLGIVVWWNLFFLTQLECGHVFHAHCCRNVLKRRWPGPRITFTFSLCPICKVSYLLLCTNKMTCIYMDLYCCCGIKKSC